MSEIMKTTKQLFEGWIVLLLLLFYTVVGGGYMYLLTQNIFVSIIIGVIGSALLFYATNIINKEMEIEQKNLDTVNKYVSIMVASLKTGSNIPESFKFTYDKVDGEIQKCIGIALESIYSTDGGTNLSEDLDLDLEAFEQFNFTALNVFHKNLLVLYNQGGDPNEMFRSTTEDINQELTYRDKLKRYKTYIAKEEYLSLVIILILPMMLVSNDIIYDAFLAIPIVPHIVSTFLYLSAVITYVYINRCKRDVKVTI